MCQSQKFRPASIPFHSGLSLAVAITSPADACEEIADWLLEFDASIHQLDHLISADIVEPAERRGLETLRMAGERALLLTTPIRRGLAISRASVEALGECMQSLMPAVPEPPLRRAVRLLRAKDAWRRAVSAWEAAEAVDVSGLSGAEQDAAVDAAREALNALVGTRAPDLATLNEKMAIMVKTDTVLANGYFDDLMADVDALRGGEPASGVEG